MSKCIAYTCTACGYSRRFILEEDHHLYQCPHCNILAEHIGLQVVDADKHVHETGHCYRCKILLEPVNAFFEATEVKDYRCPMCGQFALIPDIYTMSQWDFTEN